jgi:hypothetical protein
VERLAALEDPDAVRLLFSDQPLSAFLVASGRDRTFEVHPARILRATARQRQTVAEALDRFAARTSEYVRATAAVWRHLDAHPDRAPDILAHVFSDRLRKEELERYPVSESEAALVKLLTDAMSGVMSVFAVAEEEAFTLEELSRLVYDPLPASLTVEVPGPVSESAAFRNVEGNRWAAPSVGLWGALASLGERWVSPEPVLVLVGPDGRPPEGPFDVAAFAARPRAVKSVPAADEVKAALESGLKPPEVYRLRWRNPPPVAGEPKPEEIRRLE